MRPIVPGTGAVGFTFSQRQTDYLHLEWKPAFQAATTELNPGLVRLAAYWDEIEPAEGKWNFSRLDWLLDHAAERRIPVILTVGMKAPRWPEYYIPQWLVQRRPLARGARVSDDPLVRREALRFIEMVVQRYRTHPAVRYWQIENEALEPAGPQRWTIGADYLAEAREVIRRLDTSRRPVVANLFAGVHPLASPALPWGRAGLEQAETLLGIADVLGLDVYPSIGVRVFGRDLYLNWSRWPWERALAPYLELAALRSKRAWVIEAQAEPWEPGQLVARQPGQARSLGPSGVENIFARLRGAGFDTVLLWGVEHWYMRRQEHADQSWWDLALRLFNLGERTEDQALPGTHRDLGA